MTRWRRSTRSSGCSCSAAPPRNTVPSRPRVSTDRLCGASSKPLLGGELTELRFAERVDAWMKAEAEHAAALDLAARYAAWATHTPQGQALHKAGVLFKLPHKVDPHHLVPVETEVVDGVTMLKLPRAHRRARDGFALTDPGTDLTGALDHANYCIWCHNQGKDSCSKGLKEKTGEFKKSAVRRDARRLPARREDLRDESGRGRRPHHRRARHRRRSTIRCARPPATASATIA